MELVINELDDYNYKQFKEIEKIPENNIISQNIQQSIPPKKLVKFSTNNKTPKISYEDILSKMGMFVSDGKLHLIDRNSLETKTQYKQQLQETQPHLKPEFQQNSYIYNKYFNEYQQPVIRKPKTLTEYKQMLVHDYIQRQRVKQIKSTKLIMPTSNINISLSHQGNFNKLFNFSKR